jgi:hypothetical protein
MIDAIDAIFSRLRIRYGVSFLKQWEDEDLALVKSDWAQVLGRVVESPYMVDFGLDNLPIDRPPKNAMEFRDICLRAPQKPMLALPVVKADPAKVDASIAAMRRPLANDPMQWAFTLKEREQRGDRLTAAQRDMWRAALNDYSKFIKPSKA